MKLCGITQVSEIELINELKPDFIGMVMYFPKSKRNVTREQAEKLLSVVAEGIGRVAVVVSPTAWQLEQIQELGFNVVQVHGEVSDELIEGCGIPVWKAFNVSDMDRYPHYQNLENVTGYVFDAGEPGSGRTFDWNSLADIKRDERLFVLAGGLTPDNVGCAAQMVRPDVVDVSSGIEYSGGENHGAFGKDPEKLKDFVCAVRACGI